MDAHEYIQQSLPTAQDSHNDAEWTKPYPAQFTEQDWKKTEQYLVAEGWTPGYGPQGVMSLVDGHGIDSSVAEAAICPDCGKQCEFRAYHADGEYIFGKRKIERRPFAVCIACNKAQEF
jgi:hypothetical protein